MMKSAIRLHNIQPELLQFRQKLQEARHTMDQSDLEKTLREYKATLKKHKTSPARSIAPMLVQSPIFTAFFFALRGMGSSDPVLPGFSTGGMLWFSDLTQCDPYYILPLTSGLLFLVATSTGAETGVAMAGPMKKLFRFMALGMVFVFSNFAATLQFYVVTNSMMSLIISRLLRLPQVKRLLGMPEQIKHSKEIIEAMDPFKALLGSKPGQASSSAGLSRNFEEALERKQQREGEADPGNFWRKAMAAGQEAARQRAEERRRAKDKSSK